MDFYKMHGLGNDFVVVEGTGMSADWPDLARRMCHRHFGIGADGLLVGEESRRADFRMRIFNPDGSEAEMCGNGIRCFAKFLYDTGRTQRRELALETGAGVQTVAMELGPDGRVSQVEVRMGRPRLAPEDIPMLADCHPVIDYPLGLPSGRELSVTALSMGNPHAVCFIDGDVEAFPLEAVGPEVERHHLFPQRVNFEVCRIVSPSRLRVRVWERGAGLTLACGSGACAATVAARLRGAAERAVQVELPGGTLTVAWDGAGEVIMTGPAAFVFRGRWEEN